MLSSRKKYIFFSIGCPLLLVSIEFGWVLILLFFIIGNSYFFVLFMLSGDSGYFFTPFRIMIIAVGNLALEYWQN